MKAAYLYDDNTGLLITPISVHESPEEKGGYLVPAHATLIEPPATAEGQVAVFDPSADRWRDVPDYRGQTVYNQATGEEIVIEEHGDLPVGYGLSKPAARIAVEQRADRISQIKAELGEIDFKRIRPLAEGDLPYLDTLNAQAASLRAELVALMA